MQVHKSGVGNKTGPQSLILILICTTTIIYLIAARQLPSVEIEPIRTLTVGEQGVLYCRAHGIPEPTVQWRRVDDAPLSSRHIEQHPGYVL